MNSHENRDLFPGALEMMILQTLKRAPLHGYAIAKCIKTASDELLQIEEGSLYPALQRMTTKGWITSEWKKSPTGRQARYYRLTAAGRKQLGVETSSFERSIAAITRVLRAGS